MFYLLPSVSGCITCLDHLQSHQEKIQHPDTNLIVYNLILNYSYRNPFYFILLFIFFFLITLYALHLMNIKKINVAWESATKQKSPILLMYSL